MPVIDNVRVTPNYKNTSERYIVSSNKYETSMFYRQYFLVYRARLDYLKPRLMKQVKAELGTDIQPTVLDRLELDKKSLIIGIIIKKSKKRPTVFDEFHEPNFRREVEDDEEAEPNDMVQYDSVCSAEDTIQLENARQRITISGDIDKDDFVTGFVAALYGSLVKPELFSVERVIFPELAPQIPWPIAVEETYVMFISGVCMDADISRNESTFLALTQLIDWIHGCSSDEEIELARRVSRVVFAGDSVQLSTKEIKVTKIGQKMSFEPTAMEQFDRVLENFVRAIPVDLMPGPNDTCNLMLPQQPMVARAFDKCYRAGKQLFQPVTNPYSFEIDGVHLLGTAGQNIHDLLKYTRGHPVLDVMRQLLQRSYLFPTCPDTLDGFPLQSTDPFIVEEIPHVFFAGNQAAHEWEEVTFENGARSMLMTIPRFCERHEVVLLNLKTMKTQILRFEQNLIS